MSCTEKDDLLSNVCEDKNFEIESQQRGKVGTENHSSEKQENQPTASWENQNFVDFPDHKVGNRFRKPTEKGRAYQLELLSQKRQNCYRNLASKMRSTYEVLDAETDLRVLVDLRDTLDKSKEEFNLAQKTLYDMIEGEQDKLASYNWFDMRDREFMECRLRLTERIQTQERICSQANSIKSAKSPRSESIASSRSARSMRLEAATKSARLRAEIDFLDSERELRRLQLLKEVSIADAEERALKRIIDEDQSSNNADSCGDPFIEEKYIRNDFKSESKPSAKDNELSRPAQSYKHSSYLRQPDENRNKPSNYKIPIKSEVTQPPTQPMIFNPLARRMPLSR